MGINTSIATLLSRARHQGTSFHRTLTIGRQSMAVPVADLARIAAKFGIEGASPEAVAAVEWADDFLGDCLGADTVTSMDYSDYQHANIVHDLNTPIPSELKEQFDAVIDGGSIEHIFDVRQTLENYMSMVKVGGSLFVAAPANNLCGHGFYQFSPEFFYRVFSAENGYRVKDMFLIESPLLSVEASRHQHYFRVQDPEKLQKRVQVLSSKPVMLWAHAERVASVPLFVTSPYQSDFKAQWRAADAGERDVAQPGAPGQSFQYLTRWQELQKRFRQWRKHGLRRGKFVTPFDP